MHNLNDRLCLILPSKKNSWIVGQDSPIKKKKKTTVHVQQLNNLNYNLKTLTIMLE